jgi:hypothetical protein
MKRNDPHSQLFFCNAETVLGAGRSFKKEIACDFSGKIGKNCFVPEGLGFIQKRHDFRYPDITEG